MIYFLAITAFGCYTFQTIIVDFAAESLPGATLRDQIGVVGLAGLGS